MLIVAPQLFAPSAPVWSVTSPKPLASSFSTAAPAMPPANWATQ